jgi:D-3-phosphoglycerate dehydrogenase
MMKKILVIESIRPKGMEILRNEAEVMIAPDRSEATVASIIEEFDAVITRTTNINEQIIKNGKRLQVIGRHGAGLDIVDVKCATDNKICVVHTPAANAQSVAEFVVTMMLAGSRLLIPADCAQRIKRNYNERYDLLGHDLAKRTLGIVGMGRIGRLVAGICCQGLNMKVLGYDPFVTATNLEKIGVQKVANIATILQESDFVSLNCPFTEDVRGLINKENLALMKPDAFLINCARGPIVDEIALGEALRSGLIRGAALDVFDTEPPRKDNPLFDAPNLIATPHIAAMTHESMDLMSITVAKDVLRVLKAKKPEFLANSDVWDQRKI